jgi:hypothetical protein
VSVRCYTVLETVYRNRLHYTYSWAFTYTTLYPYNFNILYYHYYDIVKVLADERDCKNAKLVAAVAIKQILKNSNYFANIAVRTILRWTATENAVSLKPGRKI